MVTFERSVFDSQWVVERSVAVSFWIQFQWMRYERAQSTAASPTIQFRAPEVFEWSRV